MGRHGELWGALLTDYARAQAATGASVETVRTRMSYLRRWARLHPPNSGLDDMVTWLAQPHWSPSTRKSARSALRSFYRWAHKTHRLSGRDVSTDLEPVKVPKCLPRPASESQVQIGARSANGDASLMVQLAAYAGLRRTEIARARREDLLPTGVLIVHGKGGKQRAIPLPPRVRAEIERRPPGWLFPGRFSGHVHPATVQKAVRAAAGTAPHALRHRFATIAYGATRDLFAVQQLLGHESSATTERYVAIADEALLAAVLAAAA